MATDLLESRAHRLRGLVDGVERTYPLTACELHIGRSVGSDVWLPVDGVSRRHATLLKTPHGLVIQDQGSANGTFVDEQRVGRAPVTANAELRFGPVRLRLEEIDADDAELGITLEMSELTPAELAAAASDDDEQDTLAHGDFDSGVAGAWLKLVEGFLESLARRPEGDLKAALDFLAESLTLAGACAVEWTRDGEPVVMAAAGDLPRLPAYREIRRLRPGRRSSGAEVATAFFDRQPVLSLGAHFGRPREPRCLLLWGDFPGRHASGPLLRSCVCLVELLGRRRGAEESGGFAEAAPEPTSDLVFPPGYRPGISPAAEALFRQLRRLLKGARPVLLVGETGVGKEQVAKILHASSERRQGPFVAVNCAAIPAEMLEAEMFGIGRRVATGVEARAGKFQLAEGGTIFLDEIGEMAPELQAKLLRALQEREIQPVGGKPRQIDVRVVAATNADLLRRMEEGTFRCDLYYRLAAHLVEVPPLRCSQDDIPGLVEHYLGLSARDSGRRIRGLTAKALRLLTRYRWPGNVRELENEIHRLVGVAADGQVIDSAALAERIRHPPWSELERDPSDPQSLALEPRVTALETRLIRQALEAAGGKQVKAAKLLGISRNGLAKKMKRLGLRGEPTAG